MDYGCLKTDFFINYFVCFYLKLFYCLFDYMCQRTLEQLIACFLGCFQVKGYLCNQNTLIMCKFSESTKQKLGNAIIYIARHIQVPSAGRRSSRRRLPLHKAQGHLPTCTAVLRRGQYPVWLFR